MGGLGWVLVLKSAEWAEGSLSQHTTNVYYFDYHLVSALLYCIKLYSRAPCPSPQRSKIRGGGHFIASVPERRELQLRYWGGKKSRQN